MARPIWKGHISFGLVFIPISLYSAEKETGLRFHLVDRRDHARLRYVRINENTQKEVPWEETARAYEYDKDHYVILSEEDFKQAAVEASQTIEIEHFVDASEIECLFFEKPYFLVPEGKGEKGYVLLREALQHTKKVGIAKVVIRSRQYLAAVIVSHEALVLNLMRFSYELRKKDEFNLPAEGKGTYKIGAQEMKIAQQLISAMSTKWKPDAYHDDYRDKLLAFIEEKERGVVHRKKARKKPPAKVIDFMALMKKSIEEKKNHKKPIRRKRNSKKAA
jgi:DNA end-binding protein Ku